MKLNLTYTACPVLNDNTECIEYDIDGQSILLDTGFLVDWEEVSDDSYNGGKYYTEYTVKVCFIKLGETYLDRKSAITLFGEQVERIEQREEEKLNGF